MTQRSTEGKKEGKIAANAWMILGAALIFSVSALLMINLSVPLLLLLAVIYFRSAYPDSRRQPYNLLNLSLLYLIIVAAGYFIILRGWPVIFIPFSLISILSVILFNNINISVLITLVASVTVASLNHNDFLLGLLFLISGLAGALFTQDVRRRTVVIKAGFIIGILQALALIFMKNFSFRDPEIYLIVFLNGVCSAMIAVWSLPFFEYLFKTVTSISLLELADFNSPLLQRLGLEAPGTYHHSLIVGNLSEAACREVGANALLARVGAYYHDIGKLSKPDYFSENQKEDASRHNSLSPAMSKLIIMNHVKEGMDLAKKYRLNPAIIEFIQQHHGSSLVYYFYRRALENQEMDQQIKEDVFRYPGPKPNSKETAIVLLADSVEAAARALKDPTLPKIGELVHKIINNKFIDGQLDECELTLKDLERISAVFIHILGAIYHGRVTYP